MTRDQLRHLVALRDKRALDVIRGALRSSGDIRGAARSLGVHRNTLYSWGESWPALSQALARGACDPSEQGRRGGRVGSEARWGKR